MTTFTRLECNILEDLLTQIDSAIIAACGETEISEIQRKLSDLIGEDYNESNCDEIVLHSVK